MEKTHHVCKFADGLCVVPSKWMKDTSHCYFPSKLEYTTAVKKMKSPIKLGPKSWKVLPAIIKRSCGSYQEAVTSAKYMSSQVTTESDDDTMTSSNNQKRAKKAKMDDDFIYNNDDLFRVDLEDPENNEAEDVDETGDVNEAEDVNEAGDVNEPGDINEPENVIEPGSVNEPEDVSEPEYVSEPGDNADFENTTNDYNEAEQPVLDPVSSAELKKMKKVKI